MSFYLHNILSLFNWDTSLLRSVYGKVGVSFLRGSLSLVAFPITVIITTISYWVFSSHIDNLQTKIACSLPLID